MKSLSLQDGFLEQTYLEKVPVTVYLSTGFQFKGLVRGYDAFTLILDCDGKQTLVYKHSISTIVPARPIHFDEGKR